MKFLINLVLFSFIGNYLYADEIYKLTIDVNKLRNNKGVVQYSIYNKPNSLPDEKFKKFYKQKTAPISNNHSSIVFNLPKGIYAVNILHDENNNKKIDKGFLLPTEGIGLSNYTTINLMNRPNFQDASFLLDSDKNITIKINYL